jgi:glycosyltransferase involved in cell wall biosynthesis
MSNECNHVGLRTQYTVDMPGHCMKKLEILWLNHFVPYPPAGGCFQRTYNLLTRVAAEHSVHLVAVRPKPAARAQTDNEDAHRELGKHCATTDIIDISEIMSPARLAVRGIASIVRGRPLTVGLFDSRSVTQTVQRTMRDHTIDLVHFDSISLAQYLPLIGDRPSTLTHHGAESFMIRRRIGLERNPFKKAFFFAEWLALERYERANCHRFDANLVVSALDREILQSVAPKARFEVVPNGVDVEYFRPALSTAVNIPALIFAGRLDQYSNRDAILFFVREVWPLVSRAHANVVMHIVGSNPPSELRRLAAADPGLQVHGFVPDVRPFFQRSTIAVCPIRDGGGTRLKVLDALAQGLPVVATSIGCEGIEIVPDRDLLIADSPTAFASQINRLLQDEGLRRQLATNGRRLAETVYSWDGIANRLSELCRELAEIHTRDGIRR